MPHLVRRQLAQLRADDRQPQASAERYRSVVDNIVDGIITIDERGTIESFNPAVEAICGYSAAELVGQNVSLLMPEPFRSRPDE